MKVMPSVDFASTMIIAAWSCPICSSCPAWVPAVMGESPPSSTSGLAPLMTIGTPAALARSSWGWMMSFGNRGKK
jgi:hypothetical protein